MKPDRWQQVNDLFQQAMELGPAGRAEFLDQYCSGDEVLRREVESLLESDEHAWQFIEKPALEVAAVILVNDQPLLEPGKLFGHYEIISVIGHGGMGEVYLAEDKKLKRKIALKLLPVDYTKDKDRLQRFQREAQAASALNHPNILTIHELAEVDGRQFIATEFVEGETLRERLRRAPVSLPEIIDIAIQATGALAAAHAAGIVHRDIKPENIMLRPDGYVKILDFGLAKLTEQSEGTFSFSVPESPNISSGLMMGTVAYMSPEQAAGKSVDQRSDIFSLGVVLYELITSTTPFKGESTAAFLRSILHDTPRTLNSYFPGVPEGLQHILDTALQKDKTERYQTATELLVELKALSQRPGFDLRPAALVSNPSRVGLSTASRTRTLQSFASVASQIKEHKLGVTFGGLTFILIIIATLAPLQRVFNKRVESFETMLTPRLIGKLNVAGNAAISPDGRFIAYVSSEAGRSDVWIKSVDGSGEPQQIMQSEEATLTNLIYSKDGNSLYFNQERIKTAALFTEYLSVRVLALFEF